MTNLANERAPFVQLFILSRDRAYFCKQTIDSAINQTYSNYEVIVSDNSEGNEVAEMLEKEYPQIKSIQRKPTLSGFDHFNTLIIEANAPLVIFFHDDDILESEYISRMVETIQRFPDAAAAGCNAKIIRGKRLTQEAFMKNIDGVKIFQRPSDLAKSYLSLDLIPPAPFPSYIYRTNRIKNKKFDIKNGGKHADASFLISLLNEYQIVWTSEKLLQYRFHSNNWSAKESVSDRLSWLRYIFLVTDIHPKSQEIKDYKFLYWTQWLTQNNKDPSKSNLLNLCEDRKKLIVIKFIFTWIFRNGLTRPTFWIKIGRTINRKLFYKKY